MRVSVKTLGVLSFFITLIFYAVLNLIYSHAERSLTPLTFNYDGALESVRQAALVLPALAAIVSVVLHRKLSGDYFRWKMFFLFALAICLSLTGSQGVDDLLYALVFIFFISLMLVWYYRKQDLRSMLRVYTSVGFIVIVSSLILALISPAHAFLDGERLNGIFSNPHTLSRLCVVFLITVQFERRAWSASVIGGSAVAVTALLMSGSVNAILALVLSFLLTLSYLRFGRSMTLSGMAFVVAFYVFAPEIVSTLLSLVGRDNSFSGRVAAWVLGINLISDAPLSGIGMRDTKDVIFDNSISSTNFHNNYIEIGVRAGLVSVTLFFWLTFRAFRGALSLGGRESQLYVMLLLLLIILGFAQSTVFAFFTLDFYILWSVLIGLASLDHVHRLQRKYYVQLSEREKRGRLYQ